MPKDGKPLIFISHAVVDSTIADAVSELIKRLFADGMATWFSSDQKAQGGCCPGGRWFNDIHDHLNTATRVITIITTASIDRPWIYWESGIGAVNCKGGTTPMVIGLSMSDLKPPLSELEGVDGLDVQALSATLLKIGHAAGLHPADDIAKRECRRFVKRVKKMLAKSQSAANAGVTDQDRLAHIESMVENLVGTQETPPQLREDQMATQATNPKVEAAAQQTLQLNVAGLRLPAELAHWLTYQLYKSGDLLTAYALQSQLVNSDEADAVDWFNLGVLLYGLHRKDEAEEAYRKAIRAKPDYAGAWNNLGILLAHLNRKDEAEDAYRKAVEAKPDDTKAWSNLGNLLDDLDRKDEAERAYRMAVQFEPDNPDWWNGLAYCLWKHGKFELAEVEVRKALAIDPNHSYANATLGLILFEKNQLEKGRRHYEKAVEVNPDDLPLQRKFHYEYGRALGRNGKKDHARKQLELAKSIDSEYVPLEDIEEQLRLLDEPDEKP